jgi:hypothetical protein
MKPQPIKQYREPRYPARLLVIATPSLLQDHQPPAWRARGMASAAAVLITAGLTVAATDKPGKAPVKATVAPVFAHGEGRGAIGCQVILPPVFMSEEEAMSIIEEELGQAGVKLTDKNVEYKEVLISEREEYGVKDSKGNWKEEVRDVPGGKQKPLVVDRVDPAHKVAVEFVSEADYFELGGAHSSSTVQSYDMADIAKNVDTKVAAKGPAVFFAALYDPVVNADYRALDEQSSACSAKASQSGKDAADCYEQARDTARGKAYAKSKEELRAQVKDFVNWLKAQGAI